MKQPNFLLKLAAIASSVLLAGGFVGYRAGAFHWLLETDTQSGDAEGGPSLESNQTTFMGGSKFKVILEPVTPSQPTPATSPTVPTVMSGSKSLFIQVPNQVEVKLPAPPSPSPESPK